MSNDHDSSNGSSNKDWQKNLRGRGAGANPVNRYDKLHVELEHFEDIGLTEDDRPLLRTEFFTDFSRSIVNKNNSPDIPFTYSISMKSCAPISNRVRQDRKPA